MNSSNSNYYLILIDCFCQWIRMVPRFLLYPPLPLSLLALTNLLKQMVTPSHQLWLGRKLLRQPVMMGRGLLAQQLLQKKAKAASSQPPPPLDEKPPNVEPMTKSGMICNSFFVFNC